MRGERPAMSSVKHVALPAEEQERRRAAIQRALANVRLEGLEPDPAVFEYTERYIRGEITIDEAVAAMVRRRASGA